MKDYSKKTKAKLRQIREIAYERDLSRCLAVIYEHLRAWKAGKISTFDANDLVHKYHDETARELYKIYVMGELTTSVAFGFGRGVLSESEIPDEARENIIEISRLMAGNA